MNRGFLKKNTAALVKPLAITLALSLTAGMVPYQSIAVAAETEAADKTDETELYERIEIRTAQDFIDLAAECYIDAWSKDKYVVLMNDIDLEGTDFVPVPVFNGTFDGAGYTISGFNYTGSGYVVGLFRYIESNAVVKDLNLKGNIESENEQECIGSIAGVNYGTIRNCTFTGTVSGRDTVGGIVGINENTGTISGSVAKGRVTAYYSTGGIAGINHGAINYCTNRAGVNDNEAWVEEDDEMGGVEMVKNLVSTDDSEVYSGVDTGGIAGYSDGLITRCTNSGTVGYEHTGYNVGGIAGRQSGVVSLSTNTGIVYGRKDVGGIVGQMEPYIEVNEAESLRDAIDKLHDLTNKALDDMSETKNVITKDVDIMQQYADAAIDTGDDLVTQISNFADANIGETNTLTARMEHVMDMLPEVLNYATEAGDAANRLNDVLKQLSDDIDVMEKLDDSAYNETQYNRISLLSTVGGTLTSDSTNPETGDLVTITINTTDGYRLKSGTKPVVTDANGKAIAVSATNNSKKYTFTMPEQNVKVSAEFEYEGTFLVRSNVGGTVTKTVSGNEYTFTVNASNGYTNPSTITIGGTALTLTDNKVTVNKNNYSFNGSPIMVEAVFASNNETLYDVNVVSGTGGSALLVSNGSTASAGDIVTISVSAESGYSLDKIEVNGAAASMTAGSNANRYDITMPSIGSNKDYTISVTFKYDKTSNSDTSYVYTESNAGGTIRAVRASGTNKYTVTITANSGYDVSDTAITATVYVSAQLSDQSKGFTINKSELTKRDTGNNAYTYVLDTDEKGVSANIVGLTSTFIKEADTSDTADSHSVRTVSSTGGTIAAGTSSATAGETVYITPASTSGYVLTGLEATGNLDITTDNNGKTYSFTMPAYDVTVTAQFEPINIILTSNLSGSAIYSGNSKGTVTLTISPDSSYTLSTAPIVTDGSGNTVALSKRQSGSYVYEFSVEGKVNDTYKASITFTQQSNKQTIDTAKDEIDTEIDDLSKQSDNLQKSVDKIEDIVLDSDGNMKSWDDLTGSEQQSVINELLYMAEYLGDMSSSTAAILRNVSTIYDILEPYVSDAADAARDDTDKAGNEVKSAIDALSSANDSIKSIVNYVNSQEDIKFSKLGEGFDASKELFHNQLKGLSDSIKTLNDNASAYSDLVNNDLKAVNDQLNVVFNLLADRMSDAEDLDMDNLYKDVTDEDIDSITTGRVEYSTNKGIVQGDINVGGIAGSMSIDDEDPEDSAAGQVEYKLGRSFIAKCLITGSVNEGYITAKKDGAGGICGYMNHGIIVESEGYGSVESTEGDYVGGICGQSLTIIKRCYALCSVTGGQNVGGIAGYAVTLTDCYAMASVNADSGRSGAIAGQVESYEEVGADNDDEASVANNYYVNDELYGIDNISYVGVAEPISYQDLLTVENIPTEFWHLKVIYKIEDTYLGSQEVEYGAKLDNLTYPTIPAKDGCYGVWPDVTDKVMNGTIVVEAEYKDNVTVVKSTGTEDEKSIALVEDKFTEDTVLTAQIVEMETPSEAQGKESTVYKITVEDGALRDDESFSVRLLNPYEDASVYVYTDNGWVETESKERGNYLHVTMTGPQQYFCIVDESIDYIPLICGGVAIAAVLILLIALIKKAAARRKNKKQAQKTEE